MTATIRSGRYSKLAAAVSDNHQNDPNHNLYDILGVDCWTDNPLEIKHAYRELARQYHPDSRQRQQQQQQQQHNMETGTRRTARMVTNHNNNQNHHHDAPANQHSAPANQPQQQQHYTPPASSEKFQQIHQAYKVLSDPIAKERYDDALMAHFEREEDPHCQVQGPFSNHIQDDYARDEPPSCCNNDNDHITTTFGGNYVYNEQEYNDYDYQQEQQAKQYRQARIHLERGQPVRGPDLRVDLPLDIYTMTYGGQRSIPLLEKWHTCPTCQGAGVLRGMPQTTNAMETDDDYFPTSSTPLLDCPTCRGLARILVQQDDIAVRIPPGASRGTKIRLPAQGHHGWNGGPPGDLWVVVQSQPYM